MVAHQTLEKQKERSRKTFWSFALLKGFCRLRHFRVATSPSAWMFMLLCHSLVFKCLQKNNKPCWSPCVLAFWHQKLEPPPKVSTLRRRSFFKKPKRNQRNPPMFLGKLVASLAHRLCLGARLNAGHCLVETQRRRTLAGGLWRWGWKGKK